jgi:hypothetical protein
VKITVQIVIDAQDGTAPVVHQGSVIDGNTYRALSLLNDLIDDLQCTDDPAPARQALLTKVTEFRGYIHTNAAQIPNYGERHRCGEAISSATAESAVNQVISRRMVKKGSRSSRCAGHPPVPTSSCRSAPGS